ncbi:MAG TPA: hypothetical protein VGC62_07940 [Pseudomonas sp.]
MSYTTSWDTIVAFLQLADIDQCSIGRYELHPGNLCITGLIK